MWQLNDGDDDDDDNIRRNLDIIASITYVVTDTTCVCVFSRVVYDANRRLSKRMCKLLIRVFVAC